jgi:hypothetical protein
MSFFEARRLKAEAAEAANQEKVRLDGIKQQRQRDYVAQQITWMREAPNADLLDVFAKFDETIRGVTRDSTKLSDVDKTELAAFLDAFAQIHRYWFEIDRNRVTNEQAKTLFDIIHTRLPNMISSYAAAVVSNGIYDAWDKYSMSRSGAQTSRKCQQILNALAPIRDSQITNFQAKSFVPVTQNANEVTSKFPVFSTSNSAVMSTLARVNELWEQASTRKNNAEDEYFLEQVASTYIPDSWRLFQTFRFAPEASQATAEKLFLEQLALIESHLVRILSTVMEQNLMAMRSQLGFLEARVAEPEPSQLTLEATNPS